MYDMTITLIRNLLSPARLAGREAPVAVAILSIGGKSLDPSSWADDATKVVGGEAG